MQDTLSVAVRVRDKVAMLAATSTQSHRHVLTAIEPVAYSPPDEGCEA